MSLNQESKFQEEPELLENSEREELYAQPVNLETGDGLDVLELKDKQSQEELELSEDLEEVSKTVRYSDVVSSPSRDANGSVP